MPIRYKLKDLNLDEVSYVTAGDNPEARILLTKARQRRTEAPMPQTHLSLSLEDRQAMELAKMAQARPDLRDHIRAAAEAAEPERREHPLSKAAEESPAFAELLPYIEEEMIKSRVDHEAAIGRVASNPGLYPLVEAYREEQRALQDS